eukprot:scaffold110267_cov46-Prasinocladus_malaysianus.AAC.1
MGHWCNVLRLRHRRHRRKVLRAVWRPGIQRDGLFLLRCGLPRHPEPAPQVCGWRTRRPRPLKVRVESLLGPAV